MTPAAGEDPTPTGQPATADLVVAAQGGDDQAFDRLVERFAPRLLRFLMSGGLRAADAEDVAQDSFIRAYHHLDRYDARYAFTTWLFTIAHRLRCNHFRRQRPQVGFEDHHRTTAAPTPEEPDPLIDTLWAKAREFLPERQYQALWLRYGEDLELEEVAHVMDVSPGNARVLVHRGRSRLAKRLSPDPDTGLAPV